MTAAEGWEIYKKQLSSTNRGELDILVNYTHIHFCFKGSTYSFLLHASH